MGQGESKQSTANNKENKEKHVKMVESKPNELVTHDKHQEVKPVEHEGVYS